MPDADLARLMPHRPPMLLVDRVRAADIDAGEAEAVFREGGLFVGPDGLVDEAAHFELIAQTFAACAAVRRARTGGGDAPERGYMAAVRSFAVHGEARAGETLRIRVRAAGRVEDFHIVDGEVSRNGRPVASCQATILVPGAHTGGSA